MRTSKSHPLKIDSFPLSSGCIGMTLCPGRKGHSASGDDWDRDLTTDVAALKDWGAQIVISLTQETEMARLGVQGMDSALRDAGMEWLHLPIPDTRAPGAAWHNEWRSASPPVHQALDAEGSILIHCKAGLERTALVAALLQCERGEQLDTALAIIAKTRPGAQPTYVQLEWLYTNSGYSNRR